MSNEPGQPPVAATATSRDLAVPRSALAIAAHPDDVEFGAGATLAKWAAEGCIVHHLICTDGSKGSWDPKADTALLVTRRQREQRDAARALGATGEVVFLGWPDGELEAGLRQRWEVAYWIRKLTPEVVLSHDPWRRYRLHPDHRNAGFLACDGIVAARDPHFFAEQEIAHHRPSTLLLWEAEEPDHYEDVSAFVEVKLTALERHESQFESTMKVSGTPAEAQARLGAFRDRVRGRLAGHGARIGTAAAEAFKKVSDL